MQATKDSLLELLDEKANWWDVQRALWMKVDRDELPVALSTKGLQSQGLDSAGALQRTHRPPGPAPSVDGPPPRCLSCDTFHGLNHPFVPEHSQRRIQAGEKVRKAFLTVCVPLLSENTWQAHVSCHCLAVLGQELATGNTNTKFQ